MPNSPATFSRYAKKGALLVLLRLSVTVALLFTRGLKLWLQPTEEESPLPDDSSLNPKSCWPLESRCCTCTLKFRRSLRLSGAFKRILRLFEVLGVDVTSW